MMVRETKKDFKSSTDRSSHQSVKNQRSHFALAKHTVGFCIFSIWPKILNFTGISFDDIGIANLSFLFLI